MRFRVSPAKVKAWTIILRALSIVGTVLIFYLLFQINAKSIEIGNEIQVRSDARTKANQQIADENGKHIDCLAKIFAKYTEDHQPVTITNLSTCTVKASKTNNTNSQSSNKQGQSSSALKLPSQSASNAGGQAKNNNTGQPSKEPVPTPVTEPEKTCTVVLPILHTCVKL